MTTPNLQVRRATVEDLPKLIPLWKEEGLPWGDLDKRFAEFQVVEGDGGEVLGTFALQIKGLEGMIHSEAFARAELADAVRDKLWERVQIQARNHGLVRIWTQLGVPFWHTNGFQYASSELLTKRPASFAGDARPWLVTQLREDPVNAPISIDKEFALFKEAEKEQTQKVLRQARILKYIATLIALGVLVFVIAMSIRLFLSRNRLLQPPPPASQISKPARPEPCAASFPLSVFAQSVEPVVPRGRHGHLILVAHLGRGVGHIRPNGLV